MGRSIKKIWEGIHKEDILNEEIVVEHLKEKGFKIDEWHELKRSSKPYDILATKNKKKWVIEVKGGKNPPIKLENFRKILSMKNIDVVGLALVIKGHPFLLSFNKHVYSGEIASVTRKRREAAEKAVKTREGQRT
jgi:hypothetical protein